MRAVVQRVTAASVRVDGEVIGAIERGLLALVAARHQDDVGQADWLAEKLAQLRIFEDEQGKMNRSVLEIGGAALVISQFTLYGDARRGRRPSFLAAAAPEVAKPLVERVVAGLRQRGVATATGRFGAQMMVSLVNDGPVTIILETPDAGLQASGFGLGT